MQPACFAPHSGGVHDNFETSPFDPSSNIWIGYLDEPEKPYRHFISLEDLVDEAQDNYENGCKDRFPRYLITFDGRAGYSVPVHEELMFSAQCSACKGKRNCDRVLMQYFPIKVWDYARGRKTNIFLCALVFKIKGQNMLALLKHHSQGKYGFQETSGQVSKSMTVEFAKPKVGVVDEQVLSVDSNKANAINDPDLPLQNPTSTSHYAKSRNRPMVIDLTSDDEDDDSTIKNERRNTPHDTPTFTPVTQQPESHPPQIDSAPEVDLLKEFGSMMATMVADFGIDALAQPEARRLRLSMGEAAKLGNKDLLCQHFGALCAVLQAEQ